MSGLIPFNDLIPQRTDIPSQSQSLILANFTNDPLIWDVDHIPFNTNFSGTHVQNTYVNFSTSVVNTPPGFPSGSTAEASIAFTAPGIDQNTTAQYYFEQNNGSSTTFPLSAIKAFGVFNGLTADGNVTIINSWNVMGNIAQTHTGTAPNFRPTWTINLNPGTTTNDHAVIFVLSSIALSNTALALPFNWTLSSNILTIKFANTTPVIGYQGTINFLVMEI
jgi:hypothetical protein